MYTSKYNPLYYNLPLDRVICQIQAARPFTRYSKESDTWLTHCPWHLQKSPKNPSAKYPSQYAFISLRRLHLSALLRKLLSFCCRSYCCPPCFSVDMSSFTQYHAFAVLRLLVVCFSYSYMSVWNALQKQLHFAHVFDFAFSAFRMNTCKLANHSYRSYTAFEQDHQS